MMELIKSDYLSTFTLLLIGGEVVNTTISPGAMLHRANKSTQRIDRTNYYSIGGIM
jgi:hypothetical protein